MRVGATHAERGYPRETGLVATRPVEGLLGHMEGAVGPVDGRVGLLVADAGRDLPIPERQSGLDHPRGTGGRGQVSDVALHGADRAELPLVSGLPEGEGQGLHFDRVAQRRGCTVSLHVGDPRSIDAGIGLGGGDHLGLAPDAGRREAGLVAAVVVHGHAMHHGMDVVAVGQRILQAAKHHDAHAVTEAGPFAGRIEGAGAAVGAVHAPFVVDDAAVDGHRDGDATGQRHVAIAVPQGLAGLGDGHQRGAARGVDAQGRATQVELEGQPRGDVVLLVPGHHLEGAHLFDELGVPEHVTGVVGIVADARVHANGAGESRRIVRGVLEGGPGGLQEHPLLGVHQIGHAGVHPEEAVVELVGITDDATRADVFRVGTYVLGDAGVQFILGEVGDAVPG